MRYHIVFTFDLDLDEQFKFQNAVTELTSTWKKRHIHVTLHRDTAHRNRFLLAFDTDESIDELTRMIKGEPEARELFERIKEVGEQVKVSCYETIGTPVE